MLVNGILEHFPEKKLVSASGMAGYGSSNTIRTRRLMKNFYLCGDQVTEPTLWTWIDGAAGCDLRSP